MHLGVDIDGTADADPKNMASLMSSVKAAGHRISILTGGSTTKTPTKEEVQAKADYLKSLGMGSCWDKLVVFPDPPAKGKAKWCKKNDVDILIDNSAANAQLASEYCTVLVPWASIDPQKLKEEVNG